MALELSKSRKETFPYENPHYSCHAGNLPGLGLDLPGNPLRRGDDSTVHHGREALPDPRHPAARRLMVVGVLRSTQETSLQRLIKNG